MKVGMDSSNYSEGARVITKANLDIIESARRADASVKQMTGGFGAFGSSAISGYGAAKSALSQLRGPLEDISRVFDQLPDRILRIGATIVVFQAVRNAIQGVTSFITSGIRAISDYEQTLIGLKSSLTQIIYFNNEANKTGKTLPQMYAESARYAESLAEKMRDVDKRSNATYDQLLNMLQVYTATGQVLDVNNSKQMTGFTALSNAILVMTKGQDPTRQIATEMKALSTGAARAGADVARMVDTMAKAKGVDGGLKTLVKEAHKTGTSVLEVIAPYLKGFEAAIPETAKTLNAATTSFQSEFGRLQRNAFSGVVSDIKTMIWGSIDPLKQATTDVAIIVNKTWGAVLDTFFDVTEKTGEMGEKIRSISVKADVAQNLKAIVTELIDFGSFLGKATLTLAKHADIIGTVIKTYVAYKVVITALALANSVWESGLVRAARATYVEASSVMASVKAKVLYGATTAKAITEEEALTIAKERAIEVDARKLTMELQKQATAAATSASAVSKQEALAKEALATQIATEAKLADLAVEHNYNSQKISGARARGVLYQEEIAWAKRAVMLAEERTAAYARESTASAEYYTALRAEINARFELTAAQERLAASEASMIAVKEQGKALHLQEVALTNEMTAAQSAYTSAKIRAIELDKAAIASAIQYNATLLKQGATTGFVTSQELVKVRTDYELLLAEDAKNGTAKASIALMNAESEAIRMNTALTNGLTAAKEKLTLASRAAAAASSAAKTVMALLLDPLNLIIIALVAGAWAWDKWGNAAEKARKKAREGSQDVKSVVDDLKKQNDLREAQERFQKKLADEARNPKAPKATIDNSKDAAMSLMGNNYYKYEEELAKVQKHSKRINEVKAEIEGKSKSGLTKAGLSLATGALRAELDQLNKDRALAQSNVDGLKKESERAKVTVESSTIPSMKSDDGAGKAARHIKDREKVQESLLKIQAAQNAKKKVLEEIALKNTLDILNYEKDAGLITVQSYLDQKYEAEREAYDKEYELAKTTADRARISYENVNANPNKTFADKAESYKKYQESLALQAKALANVNDANREYLQGTADQKKAVYDTALSYEELAHSTAGNTVAAVLARQEAERQTAAYKQMEKGTDGLINVKKKLMAIDLEKAKQDQENNLIAIRNKNSQIASEILSVDANTGTNTGYDRRMAAIDAQTAAEREKIKATAEVEKKSIEDKIKLIRMGLDVELESITVAHNARMAAYEAENKVRFANNPAALASANSAAIAAEQEYQSKIRQVKVDATTRTNDILASLQAQLVLIGTKATKDDIAAVQKGEDAKVAAKKEMLNDTYGLMKTIYPKLAYFDKFIAIQHKEYEKEKVGSTKLSTAGSLSMVSDYASAAGGLFEGLAASQDQSSKSGFEAAKKYAIAATIMNTAAAIMNALATAKNIYAGLALSALAAAVGAIQIAKINSTSYGGGSGGISAPSGSFNAGSNASSLGSTSGIGSMIGTQYSSVYDQQTQESLQALADSADNASLAIGKVADGLTSISSLFDDEGSYLSMAVGALPSSKLKYTSMGDTVKDTLTDVSKSIFNPLNIGNAISGIEKVLFGGSWYTKSAGLALSMSGGDVDVDDYLYKKKDGGLFGKTKKKYVYTDNDVWTDIIQTTVDSIASTINHAAVAMGTTTNFAEATLGLTRIKTTGRSEEEITKDLQKWLESAANALAKTVVGLEEYTFYNENAFDAVVRLADALQTTNTALELVGGTLIDSTLAGANAAYQLQELMGGSEAFSESIETYFTSMFSEAEQDAAKASQALRVVNTAFGEMGIAAPQTKDQFKALVNSLDVTTEYGASMFAALMDVSEAFGTLQDYLVDTQKSIDDLINSAFQSAADTLSNSLDAARTQLESTISMAQTATNILIGLKGEQASPESQYLELKQAFDDAVSNGDNAAVLRIAEDFASASKSYYASGTGYSSDIEAIRQAVEPLTGSSVQDMSLGQLEMHSTYLQSISDELGSNGSIVTTISNLQQDLASYYNIKAIGTSQATDVLQRKIDNVQGSLTAQSGAKTNAELLQVLSSMVNGSTPNVLGYDESTILLAQGVVSGTQSLSDLQSVMAMKLSEYLADSISNLSAYGPLPEDIRTQLHNMGVPGYATGGITRGLSIAGEAGPEAVVPLPDGRYIPVKLSGGGDFSGVEERLDKLIRKIEDVERRLLSIETKARMVVNE